MWREVDGYPPNENGKKFLFRFDGGAHRVIANDLNEFLQIYHPDFSAKMFRTWKANFLLLDELNQMELPNTKRDISKNLRIAVENVAAQLYHTTHICRRSYLDERIINLYRESPGNFHNQTLGTDQRLIGLFQSFC